jgi:hypothetical protein
MVLAGKTLSPASHRRAVGERTTTSALRVVTVRPRRAAPIECASMPKRLSS